MFHRLIVESEALTMGSFWFRIVSQGSNPSCDDDDVEGTLHILFFGNVPGVDRPAP
jgi:hypothetical protein